MHPDDEALAAFAEADEADAAAPREAAVADHVADCQRCTAIVSDLRLLRSALGAMPDIQPPRSLRYLPAVPETRPAGWVGFLRRVTAPAMGVAAVLILVGAIGSAANVGVFSRVFQNVGSNLQGYAADRAAASSGAGGAAFQPGSGGGATNSPTPPVALPMSQFGHVASPSPVGVAPGGEKEAPSASDETAPESQRLSSTPARPPYEWLLGAGVLLLAAAFVARGYLARRETSRAD